MGKRSFAAALSAGFVLALPGVGTSEETVVDDAGRVESVVADDGGTTNYLYDDDGRLIVEVAPDGGVTRYWYDEDGVAHAVTDGAADGVEPLREKSSAGSPARGSGPARPSSGLVSSDMRSD